jgi:hypothetical protein
MSFKVTKLTVGKGKTTGDEQDQKWLRQYFELEAEIQSEHDIELAKASMEALIDAWLRGESVNSPQTTMPSKGATTTELPGVDLAKLPWKSYQTKETAKENEAAWIFANTKSAEPLLAVLKTKDKIQIAHFEYSFSGRERQFISRKPLNAKN